MIERKGWGMRFAYPGGWYEIEWREVATPDEARAKVAFLMEKRWFTNDMCAEFVGVVARHWGVRR